MIYHGRFHRHRTLSQHREVLAFVGSGPSVEVGLPTWRQLARVALEKCRRRKRNNFSLIERHYKNQEYIDQFAEIELTYGREFLHNICKNELADTGKKGEIYSILSKLEFLSYFTTNYDDILLRHLEESGKAVGTYNNSKEELESVDIDIIPSVVKLHGEFSKPETVILTRPEYQRIYHSEKDKASVHSSSPIWRETGFYLSGYSLSDPEVLHIQEHLAVNLWRKVAPIAILPDVSEDDITSWKRRYNVEVVSYTTRGSDHGALASLLNSVADVISVDNFAKKRSSDKDLRQAQALYMWYRFSPSAGGEAPIDALQSLLMTSLVNCGESTTSEGLASAVSNDIARNISLCTPEFAEALDRLVKAGWITQYDGTLKVLPKGRDLVQRYESQFNTLIDVFTRQLSFDLRSNLGVTQEQSDRFAQVVLDALIDIFELRGRNIMEMVFDDTPIDPHSITDILQTLWQRANTLTDNSARASFVGFILDLLANPSDVQEKVLRYLAGSFFCIQAMKLDPAVPKFVSQVVADRTLLIDENVLIPLTAKHEDRHEFIAEGCSQSKGCQSFVVDYAKVCRFGETTCRLGVRFGWRAWYTVGGSIQGC